MLKMLLAIYSPFSFPFQGMSSSILSQRLCTKSEIDDFYKVGCPEKESVYMVFLCYNLHFFDNININAMHALCLITSNDAANLAVFFSIKTFYLIRLLISMCC